MKRFSFFVVEFRNFSFLAATSSSVASNIFCFSSAHSLFDCLVVLLVLTHQCDSRWLRLGADKRHVIHESCHEMVDEMGQARRSAICDFATIERPADAKRHGSGESRSRPRWMQREWTSRRSKGVWQFWRHLGMWGSSRVEVDYAKGKRRRKSCGKKVMKTDVARGREVRGAEHWIVDASLKSWSAVTSTANGGFKQVRVWREDLIASLVVLLSASYLREPCTGKPHPHGDESLAGTTGGIAGRCNGETSLLTHARAHTLLSHAHFLCVTCRYRVHAWPKVFAVCVSHISVSPSPLSCFIHRLCCSRTVTSTPRSRPHRLRRAFTDRKARVKRTAARAPRRLAT